jgi:hypothetical protein
MKLHQHFEFGLASQDPFSFCQIQLALDTVQLRQRDREIAPLSSVANSKQEFYAPFISKGVRGEVKSEKLFSNILIVDTLASIGYSII